MTINFPDNPGHGETLDYQGIRYIFNSSGLAVGYWTVTSPGGYGAANIAEIDGGVEAFKYIAPDALAGSKYVKEDADSITRINWGGVEKIRTSSLGAIVSGDLNVDGALTVTGTTSLPAATAIGDVSATELQRIDGLSDNIMTLLDAKGTMSSFTLATDSGTVTIVQGDTLTVSGGSYCSTVYKSLSDRVVVDVERGTAGTSAAGTIGAVPMSSSVSYNSTTTAATSSAVMSAYSLAASKGTMSSWTVSDGDTTTTTITNGENLKFVEGTGIDINLTATGTHPDITISGKTATQTTRGITYESMKSGDVNSGYWRDPNSGMYFKWGRVGGYLLGSFTVNYPDFPIACIACFVHGVDTSTGDKWSVEAQGWPTRTSASFRTNSSYNLGYMYLAIGY